MKRAHAKNDAGANLERAPRQNGGAIIEWPHVKMEERHILEVGASAFSGALSIMEGGHVCGGALI